MSIPSYLPLIERDILQPDRVVVDLFRSQSSWIWTPELPTPPDAPGSEQRAFRKTFTAPPGKSSSNATIVIAVDNYFAMYINGALVHAADPGSLWETSLAFTVPISGEKTVFAIRGVNVGDPVGTTNSAGLRAAVGVSFLEDSSANSEIFYTGLDQSWLGERIIPEGWEQPDFDDRTWKPAFVYSDSVKTLPWNDLRDPTKVLVGTTVPNRAGSSSIATITLAVPGRTGVVSPSGGEFAGVIIGVVTVVAVLVGLSTYYFMVRQFRAGYVWGKGVGGMSSGVAIYHRPAEQAEHNLSY